MPECERAVSVVIPSRNRPSLVCRAVRSALRQTLPPAEVVVVVDGPDEQTAAALCEITDPRLRVLVLPDPVGAPEARNAGVRASRQQWVAFLDDDDEWLPEKLERQLAAAACSRHRMPIVGCRLLARRNSGDVVRPTRLPRPGESLGEYLFSRRSPLGEDGLMQTSTLLAGRQLLLNAPWRACAHDDWDWLLRASQCDGVGVEMLDTPLAIWYLEGGWARLSHTGGWRLTLEWWRSVRPLVSQRTYSSFLLQTISQWAREVGDHAALSILLGEAWRYGRPASSDVLVHIARWLVPRGVRGKMKLVGPAKTRLDR